MLSLQGEVLEAGVDWITCTAKSQEQQDRLRHRGQAILQSEIQTGEECRPWTHKGYQGFSTGHCEVATRHDSTIVRLHGHTAATDWFDVFQECENVSRFDLQCTFRHPTNDGCVMVDEIYRHSQKTKLHGKPLSWHLRRDSSKGDTIELGRRISDVFIRGYCKRHESRLEHYDRCFRFEVELHKRMARTFATALADGRSTWDGCQAFLHKFAQERGIVLPCASNVPAEFVPLQRVSSRQSWLLWIEKSIKPRLEREWSRGGNAEILAALGLSKIVTVNETLSDTIGQEEN
jgi:hypothetical protein